MGRWKGIKLEIGLDQTIWPNDALQQPLLSNMFSFISITSFLHMFYTVITHMPHNITYTPLHTHTCFIRSSHTCHTTSHIHHYIYTCFIRSSHTCHTTSHIHHYIHTHMFYTVITHMPHNITYTPLHTHTHVTKTTNGGLKYLTGHSCSSKLIINSKFGL